MNEIIAAKDLNPQHFDNFIHCSLRFSSVGLNDINNDVITPLPVRLLNKLKTSSLS